MRKTFGIATMLLLVVILLVLFVSCVTTKTSDEVEEVVQTPKTMCKIILVDWLNEEGKPEEQMANVGDEYTVPDKTREDATLKSVNDINGRSYRPGEKFTVSTDTILLYRWIKSHTLTIVGLEDEPKVFKVNDGVTFIVPPAQDNEGYNLVSITDASGKPYWIGNQFEIHSDLKLTYRWEKMFPETDWNKEDIEKVGASLAQSCLNSPVVSRFAAKAVEKTHGQNTAIPSVPVISIKLFAGVPENKGKQLGQALQADILANGEAAIAPSEEEKAEASQKTPANADFVLQGWIYETFEDFDDFEEVKTYNVTAQLVSSETGFIVWEDTDSQISRKYFKFAK